MKKPMVMILLLSFCLCGCNLLADRTPEQIASIEAQAHEIVDKATDVIVETVPVPTPIKEPVDTVLDYIFKGLVTLVLAGMGAKKLKDSQPGKFFG